MHLYFGPPRVYQGCLESLIDHKIGYMKHFYSGGHAGHCGSLESLLQPIEGIADNSNAF